jgi:hypothetical protein
MPPENLRGDGTLAQNFRGNGAASITQKIFSSTDMILAPNPGQGRANQRRAAVISGADTA